PFGSRPVLLSYPTRRSSDLAAAYDGTISYRDTNSLVVGTVTDTSMGTTTTSGIKTNGTTAAGFDVKLTTGGALTIGTLTSTTEVITLCSSGDLTINVTGAVTQATGNVITAATLQLLCIVTFNLDETTDIDAPSLHDALPIFSYRDTNSLVVGTVTDTAMGTTTTSGIKTNGTTAAGFDVKLTTGG